MSVFVNTYNEIIGFHYYPDAPNFCSYLGHKHRHVFVVRCKFLVSHSNRDIEINDMQERIESFLVGKYGTPCDFGSMSCEQIAEVLIRNFSYMVESVVLEDGYGGATFTR